MPLIVDSKFLVLEEEVRFCSDDTTGELLRPEETTRAVPGLASAV